MKRRDLINAVAAIAAAHGVAWHKVREGGDHTVYRIGNRNIVIPRHREIAEGTARGILNSARKEVDQ